MFNPYIEFNCTVTKDTIAYSDTTERKIVQFIPI
jgi:hypothetical protein